MTLPIEYQNLIARRALEVVEPTSTHLHDLAANVR